MRLIRIVVIFCAVVVAVIAGGLVMSNVAQSQTLREQSAIISTLSTNNDALRKQVEAHGQTPVAPPARDVVEQKGDPGAVGPQGPGPSEHQIADALVEYCTAHGGCIGPAGATGVNGTNGQDGGPGSDGPTGPQGPAGVNGQDGRGIASTVCDDNGEWQVTYTDGTTQDAGACRASLIP